MKANQIHVVTGALGFSGKYIAQRLVHEGHRVISLTNSPNTGSDTSSKIELRSFNFDDPDKLAESLKGTSVLYNTYWVRFNHKTFRHSDAIKNTLTLFKAAKRAGVERIVHISITNPSESSDLEYFRGKALLEKALCESGLSYAILRPAVIFGKEDILINNIAWFVRKFPFFGVFGDGRYKIQPIYVEDLAKLAFLAGQSRKDGTIDAIGPETYTYRDLVIMICNALGVKRPIISISPSMGYVAAKIVGSIVGDVILTRPEIDGLMRNYLHVDAPPAGTTKLSEWAIANASVLGKSYQNELARRVKSKQKGEHNNMKTTILELYAMLVCFATVACFAISAGIGMFDLVQIGFPEFTKNLSETILSERHDAFQSLVFILIICSINMIVFSLHWKIGKQARETSAV
jgi:NADH dehydrogenase